MERMNYINRPKPAYTQEERIEYLEKSLRELRTEKCEIRKEKGEYRHKILRLEEENKSLKNDLMEDMKEITKLEEENKKLKERVSELEDVSEDYDLLSKDFITLGEENEKLKSDLAYERTMLDNVRAEYKSLQNVIKKLKEELKETKET